jgi:hypothetical protein
MDTEVVEVEPTAPTPPPPANDSKAAWIVAGVATAVALIAAMIAVSAVMRDDNGKTQLPTGFQSAGFSRPVAGEISSIDGKSFKVKETTANGDTTTSEVTTNDKTTFRQSVDGALSDLAVGDTVAVTGATADNVVTATRVVETAGQATVVRGDGPGPGSGGGPIFNSDGAGGAQGGPPRVFRNGAGNMSIGEITKIEGDTITMSTFDGSTTAVKTTSTTTYRINKTIALRNLKVGDTVRVFGPVSGNKVVANEVTKGALDDALAS